MQVAYGSVFTVETVVLFTKQLQYYTPRVVLLEQLEKGEFAEWIDKMTKCRITDKDKLSNIWIQRGLDMPGIGSDKYFWDEIFGAVSEQDEGTMPFSDMNIYNLITLSTERRRYVLDLVPGKIYEWVIKFLLEQTRTDWVQWTSKEALEFQVSNCSEFGKWYANVNGSKESVGHFIIKLLLNSYCITKILSKVDHKSRVYKFDKDWYEREINKPANKGIEFYHGGIAAVYKSLERFPSLTLQ